VTSQGGDLLDSAKTAVLERQATGSSRLGYPLAPFLHGYSSLGQERILCKKEWTYGFRMTSHETLLQLAILMS